jgi:uncharacterized protein (DUF1810 family)
MRDPFDLQRFLDAQKPVYAQVCAELTAGQKSSHWMWFIFPQMRGLGRSRTAESFGMSSLAEAKAYSTHPVLGARIRECCRLLLAVASNDASAVFGFPDDLKLRSSMTLFSRAVPEEAVFRQVLEKFFNGTEDAATLNLIC